MVMVMVMVMVYQTLTQVVDIVARLVQCSGIELEPNDGEDDDRKEEEEGDVHLPMSMMTMSMMPMSMIPMSMMTVMTLTRMKVLFTRGPIALAMEDITTWRPAIEKCNKDGFFPRLQHLHCPIITILESSSQICSNRHWHQFRQQDLLTWNHTI